MRKKTKINHSYDNNIEYLKCQESTLKAVYEADGNVRKAARTLGWDYDTVREIFRFQVDCHPEIKRRRLGQKETAYVLWHRASGVIAGYANWKEMEDWFRQSQTQHQNTK